MKGIFAMIAKGSQVVALVALLLASPCLWAQDSGGDKNQEAAGWDQAAIGDLSGLEGVGLGPALEEPCDPARDEDCKVVSSIFGSAEGGDLDMAARTTPSLALEMSIGQIKQRMKELLPAFEACRKAHAEDRLFALSFVIGPQGMVTNARVRTREDEETGLTRCYEEVLLGSDFGDLAIEGELKIEYPIDNRSQEPQITPLTPE